MSSPASPDSSLLLAVLDQLPTGVWVARASTGELTYANAVFAEITGMAARTDVQAGSYVTTYAICDRAGRPYDENRLPFARAKRERRTVVVDDIVIERPDGSRRYVRAEGKPLFDATGEVSHVMVAFADISAEVAAHAERSLTRERLSAAVSHAPIVLFAADLDGTITVSDGAALAGLGVASGQLVGANQYELYRDDPHVLENLRRVLSGETFTTVTEHGQTVLETWLAPVRDDAGAITGMIGVSTDVTERLRMQRQLAHADRMSSLGRLAASVAHEINNPLTYMIEAARLAGEIAARLARDSSDGQLAQLRKLLDDAAEGAERVRLITRDLKAFAHPDEDARRAVSLDDAVATAVKLVAKRTGTRAEIVVETRSGATVRADENRLVQIFVNLLLNAAEALPSGARDRLVIHVSTQRQGDHAVIEVADNGPGVPPELRDRVFDPFFTTKSVGEGTGLGLYVTRTLVDALSGTITSGSSQRGGALFTVTLPAEEGPPAIQASPSRPPRLATRPRVMIVDDEPALARVLRLALEDDCQVATHESARKALHALVEEPPYDVVFCDLMMSDMGGLELYEQLRARAPGRERDVVFMTGGVFDPRIAQLLHALPNRCVDKPFDIRIEVWRHLATRTKTP